MQDLILPDEAEAIEFGFLASPVITNEAGEKGQFTFTIMADKLIFELTSDKFGYFKNRILEHLQRGVHDTQIPMEQWTFEPHPMMAAAFNLPIIIRFQKQGVLQ